MRRLLIAAAAAGLVAAGPARAMDIQVQVSTLTSAKGVVRAEVCRAFEWLKNGCVLAGVAPARVGMAVVIVHDVPPGIYAIVAWHDRNNNGKVDQNWLGIPEEGVGFSNDPPLGLHGPHFTDSAVTLGPDETTVAVHLKFE